MEPDDYDTHICVEGETKAAYAMLRRACPQLDPWFNGLLIGSPGDFPGMLVHSPVGDGTVIVSYHFNLAEGI